MAVENLEHYTLERLVKECQKVSGSRNAVKLVIVHRSRNSKEWIGEEYPVASDERDNIHSTTYFGAVDVAWLEGDKSDADKVSSLLRWLDNSCPTLSRIDNWYKGALRLVELVTEGDINAPLHVPRNTYLVRAKNDITTVCSRLLASKDKSACFALTKLEINHFKKYPSCQWIMEWGDVVSAIEVAALKLAGEHINGVEPDDILFALDNHERKVYEAMYNMNQSDLTPSKEIRSRTQYKKWNEKLQKFEEKFVSQKKVDLFVNRLLEHNPPLATRAGTKKRGVALTGDGRKLWSRINKPK